MQTQQTRPPLILTIIVREHRRRNPVRKMSESEIRQRTREFIENDETGWYIPWDTPHFIGFGG
jgi:hypothetical protein